MSDQPSQSNKKKVVRTTLKDLYKSSPLGKLVDKTRSASSKESTPPLSLASSTQNARKTGSTMKENANLTGRFLQTLVMKAANVVDGNPAKVALHLAKAIIETKNVVEDNKDAVRQRIESTGAQLAAVAEVLLEPKQARHAGKQQWVDQFMQTLGDQVKELIKLRDGSTFRRILDHEDEQKRIADIFERINEARVQFELAINTRVFKSVYGIEQNLRKALWKDLVPSKIADHKYYLESEVERQLRREVCTPGTRIHILDDIVTWAKNTSADSHSLYWLFGPAGTGKSTTAYTVARRFEFAGDSNDETILGGNFFCSRQFEETRLSRCIVRTIVYDLALKCKAFADELSKFGDFDIVNQNVSAQLEGLLIAPWHASKSARFSDLSSPPSNYLIVIDALDEINGTGGSEFLRDLLNVIRTKRNQLKGLKFFITSRQDQDLVTLVDTFEQKQLYRLQDVAEEEVRVDIVKYLRTQIIHFNDDAEVEQLATLASGLFIYATTVVNHLKTQGESEQNQFL